MNNFSDEYWNDMLERVERAAQSFGRYRSSDGDMSYAAPSSQMVRELIDEFKHVIQYARDTERGNAVLRDDTTPEKIAVAIMQSEEMMWLMVGANHIESHLSGLRPAWAAYIAAGGKTYGKTG